MEPDRNSLLSRCFARVIETRVTQESSKKESEKNSKTKEELEYSIPRTLGLNRPSTMFHNFFRRLVNDERLIQRLSESSVMRSAARLFASLVYRGKESAARSMERLSNSSQVHSAIEGPRRRLERFSAVFRSEYQKALEEKRRLK